MTTRALVSGINTQIASRYLRKEGPRKAEITGKFYRITSLKRKDKNIQEKNILKNKLVFNV